MFLIKPAPPESSSGAHNLITTPRWSLMSRHHTTHGWRRCTPAVPPSCPASASPDCDTAPGPRHRTPAARRRHKQPQCPASASQIIHFRRLAAAALHTHPAPSQRLHGLATARRSAPPSFAPAWSPTNHSAWLAVEDRCSLFRALLDSQSNN